MPAGIGPIVAKGRTIVLGDLPGTREVPELVGRIACHAASTGRSVRVVLELPPAEQRRIDAFLRSRGDLDDRNALVRSPFWLASAQLGASEAMLALFERVRELGAAGLDVDVEAAQQHSFDRSSRADLLVLALVDARRPIGRERWTVRLRIVAAGGEAWGCDDEAHCHAKSVAGAGDGDAPRVRWTDPPSGWDGTLYVGAVTASPPVIEPPPG